VSAPAAPAGGAAPALPVSATPAPVPSCVRVGKRVDNLALHTYDGKTWELRRDRGEKRLVLLDFWYSTCRPCMEAIPKIIEWDRKYRSWGLGIVGIAYEQGTAEEQRMNVGRVKARYGIKYPVLLGGGGTGPCPVKTQFEVTAFPSLVLLDEKGQIVFFAQGLDAQTHYDLEMEIRRRLGIR
jgi:thiol-disulfide isomerase/thioredoxin